MTNATTRIVAVITIMNTSTNTIITTTNMSMNTYMGATNTALSAAIAAAQTPIIVKYNAISIFSRDYFFYDPRSGGTPAISLGGIVVPVVQVPNSVMASTAAANNKTKMPIIIGDLEEAITNFDRQQFSIAASTEATVVYTTGEGQEAVTNTVSAFQNNLTFFRAFMRNDIKSVDSSAWLNCSITA